MLCREIIAVCSDIHINTLCGQNVELLILTWTGHKVDFSTPYKLQRQRHS